LQRLFDETAGEHPVFNKLDANSDAMPEPAQPADLD
jgi:hypothetical protein